MANDFYLYQEDSGTLVALTPITLPTETLTPGETFTADGQPLTFDDDVNIGGTIIGFEATYDGNNYIITTDGSLTGDPTTTVQVVDNTTYNTGTGASGIACYARSTMIRTQAGEVPIEALSVGDLVATASGALRPVVWTGYRRIETATHPKPHDIWPILVTAGAIADGVPSRDLWLSPGHNVALNGSLMPISALQNGKTIVQVRTPVVEYWHVELNQHDVIIADGMAAESYLDTGNRMAFVNGGEFIEQHADFTPRHWADTCIPLVFDGASVDKAKASILSRAKAAGHELVSDDDLHLRVDGRRVDPLRITAKRAVFMLPEDAQSIALRSNTFVPAHVNAASGDRRELGICVGRLLVDGIDVDFADAAWFGEGWYNVEVPPSGVLRRWNKGEVTLPSGTRFVMIDLASRGYYWKEDIQNVVSLFA